MTRPPQPEPLAAPCVDTHCHLDLAARGTDRGAGLAVDEAIELAAASGVTRIIQVGCDLPSARWSVDLVAQHPTVKAAVGIHPNDAARMALRSRSSLEEGWAEIEELASRPGVVAVGETGLDYFRTGEEGHHIQEESFRAHIRISRVLDRTLVIHDRDAHEDVIRILEDEGAPSRVVFHCFSGDAEMARYVAARGWYLSFAGVVTFASSEGLREALAAVPLDRVLVETDAPYLTPIPYRGQANASYLVPLSVRRMAEVRQVDEATMARALWDNAIRAFGPL